MFLSIKFLTILFKVRTVDLMKRVNVNGMTGTSWRFKNFEKFAFIVVDINKKSIVS